MPSVHARATCRFDARPRWTAPARHRGPGSRKELGAFGVVGAACFLLDVALFQVLYAVVGADAVLAKLLATLVSMTAAYLGHRYWSFSHRARTGLRREYLLFAAVNGATLCWAWRSSRSCATRWARRARWCSRWPTSRRSASGTVIRYLGYRAWVFPARRPDAAAGRRPAAAGGRPPPQL